MDVHLGNPAGRLFLFLNWTSNYPDSSAALRTVWSEFFEEDSSDTADYVSRMIEVLQLPDAVEAAVEALRSTPVPRLLLLRPIGDVRENLASAILGTNPVSWAKSTFDSGVLNDLEICSHILTTEVQLRSGDPDQLRKIRSLVLEVIEETTSDGQLDDEARDAVLRYAHALLRALDLHKVRGPQALIDELDRFTSASRRLKTKPTAGLAARLTALTGAIVTTVGLFTAPVDTQSAINAYGEMWALPTSVEAPTYGVTTPPSV